ncbi:MAG: DUF177 domain-containing protein [Candidatus Omnitrophica bacterium]|nr:DUF177 domain-containing protein [Candidatus Omnitrophota bacterium]
MIKFLVKDINSKGLDYNQTLTMEQLGLTSEEIDLRSPITVKARIERIDNLIIARTKVSTDFGYMCSRCLEDFHEVQEIEYYFDFEVTPDLEFVDLGEEIRQEMILANPARILCKDDCKGICVGCGVNLNLEKCKCK